MMRDALKKSEWFGWRGKLREEDCAIESPVLWSTDPITGGIHVRLLRVGVSPSMLRRRVVCRRAARPAVVATLIGLVFAVWGAARWPSGADLCAVGLLWLAFAVEIVRVHWKRATTHPAWQKALDGCGLVSRAIPVAPEATGTEVVDGFHRRQVALIHAVHGLYDADSGETFIAAATVRDIHEVAWIALDHFSHAGGGDPVPAIDAAIDELIKHLQNCAVLAAEICRSARVRRVVDELTALAAKAEEISYGIFGSACAAREFAEITVPPPRSLAELIDGRS